MVDADLYSSTVYDQIQGRWIQARALKFKVSSNKVVCVAGP